MTDFEPQRFTSDKQRDLYEYWLKIKGDLLMPARKSLNPADIPHLLSSISMVDVINGDKVRFKIRLFGTELVHAFQIDITSQALEKAPFSREMIGRLSHLVKTKEPYYYRGDFPIESQDFKYYSALVLPMSSDNANVDIILASFNSFS